MAREFRLRNVLATTALTTAATTAAAVALSLRELGKPAAVLNATSHIAWGDRAAECDDFDVQHTVLGGLLNAGAMLSWSVIQGWLFPRARGVPSALLVGGAVSTLAYVVDYHIVPKRFTPGFEKRLSARAMGFMYLTLGGALAAGAWFDRRIAA